MKITVDVEIPDPKFPSGTFIATPHGHILYIQSIHSEMVRSTSIYTGSGRPGVAPHRHTYVLVVQKSPTLQPGRVLLAEESPTSILNQCRDMRQRQGVLVPPDSLDA